jgi:excisionase family DNA binding protein
LTAEKRDTLPDMLWTVHQVAEYLQVSESWVYRKARADELPHFYIGALLRFSPEQIRAFAEGRSAAKAKVVSIKPGTLPVRTGKREP